MLLVAADILHPIRHAPNLHTPRLQVTAPTETCRTCWPPTSHHLVHVIVSLIRHGVGTARHNQVHQQTFHIAFITPVATRWSSATSNNSRCCQLIQLLTTTLDILVLAIDVLTSNQSFSTSASLFPLQSVRGAPVIFSDIEPFTCQGRLSCIGWFKLHLLRIDCRARLLNRPPSPWWPRCQIKPDYSPQ